MGLRISWRPARRAWYGAAAGIGILSAGAVAVALGRGQPPPRATASPPTPVVVASTPDTGMPSGYARQPVAYVYGSIPITREELGEYLIARLGADRLEMLVNRRIIEHVCRQSGVEVTAGEVEAALQLDLKTIQVDEKQFVTHVLKQRNITLYEYKEDVIRPRLLMTKLSRKQITVEEKEIQDAYESRYGERVECRLILFPHGEERAAFDVWKKVRHSDQDFDHAARHQGNPYWAAIGGNMKPFGRSSGLGKVETVAFSLQEGEVSQLIDTPEGNVILKCVKRYPPDKDRTFDKERETLAKEVFDRKVTQSIAELFKKMRDEADPKLLIQRPLREDELKRDVLKELQSGPGGDPRTVRPHGN